MSMMKRALAVLALTALAAFALQSTMAGAADEKAAAKAKVETWTGEVVDMGCYVAHGAAGEKHVECGTKCVANGMPMGLLGKDGKLRLLTMNHDNPDPYNDLKKWVDQQVEVSGTIATRAGVTAIDVQGAKQAAAAAAPAK
jgi:hypothetical protein